ncbi:MAG: 2-oxoacid:acceptor oxidoreductase family protein, partial [Proteobacteria bacterium]|nr:2-oxoacid:acceptor oxidoreductase family protein [Pseudomonadota bacterium]
MDLPFPLDRDRITIAILALGGEGGGVLADWIQEVASRNGYITQGTSVPGVAQRTGSTVYYIEMIRRGAGGANRPDPVLAMMPVPGDVDIVIASELMEAGRAILRGFVSEDRTTLIGSTHRVYAIAEKAAMGDGTGAGARILDAAERRSHRFIGFDMAAAASASGSVISSVMFGALAASESLPFPRDAFEDAIRHGGKASESNPKGFELGVNRARNGDPAAP